MKHPNLSGLPAAFSVFAILFAASCSVSDPIPVSEETPETEAVGDVSFLPGVVTVQFDDEMTALVEKALQEGETVATRAPELGGVLDGMGIKSLRRVFPDAGEYEPRTRREGLHRFYYVEFAPSLPVTKASEGLSAVPGVVSVTPQIPIRPRSFNDPYFSSQWHFVNTRYKGSDINVQKVWDEFTTGRSDVIVSVVDEGVVMDHEDLVGNLIPCLADGSGSFNFNNNTPTVVPTQGHGTHVAGVIAAVSNNGIGVAGIAGGDAAAGIPGVKVMSCQIFDLYGNQPDTYQAIKHGADHGAVILQCSWGFSPDLNGDGFTTQEEINLYRSYTIKDLPEYKAAIDYFIKYAGCDNDGNQLPDSPMKGGVAIFAAGNDNFDYDPLVSYEPIIAVGAFGATGNKASYSNYGDWVDVAAPGGDAKLGIYSTLLSNNYGGSDWQGTSMACPHVSGVAALLVSYFGGPGFTAEECRTRIVRGAVPNYFSGSRYIGRKLDAYGAFTFDMDTPIEAPELLWSGETPEEIAYNEKVEVPFTVKDPQGQYVALKLTPEKAGITLGEGRVIIDARTLGSGTYAITLTGTNEDKATSRISYRFSVLKNLPPVSLQQVPDGIVLDGPGATASFSLGEWFNDPDEDPLSFTAALGIEGLAELSVDEAGTLTVKGLQSGLSTLTVKASDGENDAAVSIPFAVKNPSAPVYARPTRVEQKLTLAIDAAASVPVTVEILSATGTKVMASEVEADIFHPVTLAVHSLAPGIYTAKVTYSGTTHETRFVKL